MPCAVAEPITQGQEAFVPPANFAEFHERYPRLVRWWLYHKMKCPAELIPDYEQSLFVHLMGRSRTMAEAGVVDRVASYDPEKTGENIRNPFGVWVAYICGKVLRNEYMKMVEREARIGVERRSTTLSLSDAVTNCEGMDLLSLLNMKGWAAQVGITPGQVEDLIGAQVTPSHGTSVVSAEFWSGFVAFVDDRAPEIATLLRALEDYDTLGAARTAMGISTGTYREYRARLAVLLKDYRSKKRR